MVAEKIRLRASLMPSPLHSCLVVGYLASLVTGEERSREMNCPSTEDWRIVRGEFCGEAEGWLLR